MSKRRPFLLYHWSPTKNRKSILHDGLCPLKPANLDGNDPANEGFRATNICFTRSPSASWALSATVIGKAQSYDLWMVWSDVKPYKTLTCDSSIWTLTEYRIFERIPKSKIWYVGTREYIPRKNAKKQ